jgi:hypothetical protein
MLTFVIFCALMALNSIAAIGATLEWSIGSPIASSIIARLYDDGSMVVSGTGATIDFEIGGNGANQPWISVRDKIKSVEIQQGITHLAKDMFISCVNLTTVRIAASVQRIDQGFLLYSGVQTIIIAATTPPTISGNCSLTLGNPSVIMVPSSAVSAYQTASCWSGKTFEGMWEIGNPTAAAVIAYLDGGTLRVTGSGNTTADWNNNGDAQLWRSKKNSITSIVVGEGVTSLGRNFCTNCSNLQTVTLPSTIQCLGRVGICRENVFVNTPSMKTINIAAGNVPAIGTILGSTSVGYAEADNKTWAAKITLNLTGAAATNACKYANHAGWRLFEHGAAVGSKYFGKAVPTNGSGYPASSPNTFRFYLDCNGKMTVTGSGVMGTNFGGSGVNQPWKSIRSSIKAVEFQNGIQASAIDIFTGCTALTSVVLPASITSLQYSTFYGCTGITQIKSDNNAAPTLPNSTSGNHAFSGGVPISNITLIINDAGVCNYGIADKWKDMIIPQLMFKFEDNK